MIKYILVQWPYSQMLMEHERFNECLLVDNIEGHEYVGSSAYMCPEDLYNEIFIKYKFSGEKGSTLKDKKENITKCDCGGTYKWDGTLLLSNPAKYPFYCDRCHNRITISEEKLSFS